MKYIILISLLITLALCNKQSLQSLSGLSAIPHDDCLTSTILDGSTMILNKCSYAIEGFAYCSNSKNPFKSCYLRSGPIGYFKLNSNCVHYFSRRFVGVPPSIFNTCESFDPEKEAESHSIKDEPHEMLPNKGEL